VIFTGGVAKNPCVAALLEERLGRRVRIPGDPQMTGALGAALLAMETPAPPPKTAP
jgi:activator of 2-hydroxyglutaryl-CoA dehydratase